ncbi:Translation factor GUF1-like, mitochondrial, partial [Cucurbita argyrosperma subsp. sororia]
MRPKPTADPDRVKAQLKPMFCTCSVDIRQNSASLGCWDHASRTYTSTGILLTSQVGYVVSGMRSTKEARIGDTLHQSKSVVEPLPCFKPVKHRVFSGLYPADGSDFDALNHALERLTCNDASVSVTKETSTALGLDFSQRHL